MAKRKQKEIDVSLDVRLIPADEATPEQLEAAKKMRALLYKWVTEIDEQIRKEQEAAKLDSQSAEPPSNVVD